MAAAVSHESLPSNVANAADAVYNGAVYAELVSLLPQLMTRTPRQSATKGNSSKDDGTVSL